MPTIYFLNDDSTIAGSGDVPFVKSKPPNCVYWRDDYFFLTNIQYVNCPAYMKGSVHDIKNVPSGSYRLLDSGLADLDTQKG